MLKDGEVDLGIAVHSSINDEFDFVPMFPYETRPHGASGASHPGGRDNLPGTDNQVAPSAHGAADIDPHRP